MIDFAYNLGVARYRASTLRRKVDQRDWEAVKMQLMRWTRGGGKVLPGLVTRREAEAAWLLRNA
jgi:lysozyme